VRIRIFQLVEPGEMQFGSLYQVQELCEIHVPPYETTFGVFDHGTLTLQTGDGHSKKSLSGRRRIDQNRLRWRYKAGGGVSGGDAME
jgi:hypothetical protein